MPPAVSADRRKLSLVAIEEILGLMRPAPFRFCSQMLGTWLVIGAAMAVAAYCQSIPVFILAVCVIGTRQNILGLLMHEQCHSLGFKSSLGTLFANFTAAYPILFSVEGYRGVHLEHHQHFFTDKDPDYLRKQGKEWSFPQQGRELLKTFLADATGMNIWKTHRSKRAAGGKSVHGRGTPLLRLVYYAALASVLTVAHLWTYYLLYWIVPLFTVLQVIIRWGAICEHKYDLVAPSVAESTPIIRLKWWESLLFPNLNFTYHIYHHYYPQVPYHHLPRIHEIYRREGLVKEGNVFEGYHAYLKSLLANAAQADHARKERAVTSQASEITTCV